MLAVLEQTVKVKSVEEVTEIIKVGLENMKTNLSFGYLISYLAFITDFDSKDLVLEQIPGKSVYTNGVWVFEADINQTKNLFEELCW